MLGEVVDGLVAYTQSHFDHEEGLFAQYGYADARAHQAEHQEFTRRVLDLQARFRAARRWC